jgi:hypothetical protein
LQLLTWSKPVPSLPGYRPDRGLERRLILTLPRATRRARRRCGSGDCGARDACHRCEPRRSMAAHQHELVAQLQRRGFVVRERSTDQSLRVARRPRATPSLHQISSGGDPNPVHAAICMVCALRCLAPNRCEDPRTWRRSS